MEITDHQNTKIVATVGPACNSREKLVELVQAGVDVFRLNFSHGTHEDHRKVIEHVSHINKTHGLNIGLLADLQGPKLRVGKVQEGGIPLKKGDVIRFTNKECIGTKESVYMSYPANSPIWRP